MRKWVTSEVLPAIRKTGIYVGKPFAVNPGDVLTQEEQNTLRLMLKTAADRLPKAQQGALMVKGWSKLKSHFGVTYREIPRQEFSEAVSIVARHAAEWEVVDKAPKTGSVQEIVAEWVKKIQEPNGYPAFLFMPLVEAVHKKLGMPDAQRIKAAFALGNQANASVQQAVFDAVLESKQHPALARWVLCLHSNGDRQYVKPYVKEMPIEQFITSPDELPSHIHGPDSMTATEDQIAAISVACTQRLAATALHRGQKIKSLQNSTLASGTRPGTLKIA